MKRLDGKPRVFDKKKKLNRFLDKARNIHADKYTYFDDYENCKKKIKIECRVHGIFLQTPDSHLQGKGCPHCNENKGGVKYSTTDIVNKFKDVHGNKYDYSLVNYVNSSVKVKIICKVHGIFEQSPHSHLNGSGCGLCAGKFKTEGMFLDELKSKGFKTIEYVGGFSKYTKYCDFICTKHGNFKSKPINVLNSKNGCRLCANEAIGTSLSHGDVKIKRIVESTGIFKFEGFVDDDHFCKNSRTKVLVRCLQHNTIEERSVLSVNKIVGCSVCLFEHKRDSRLFTLDKFIEKANYVHDNFYDYSDSVYKDSYSKINIKCPNHGEFTILANRHLQGGGCPKCTVRSSWSREGFVDYVDKKFNGKSKIYLLRCYDEYENFLKIGMTCQKIEKRFSTKITMPYNYEVLLCGEFDGGTVYDTEKAVLKMFKKFKYTPDIPFGGKTECFKIECKDDVFNYVKGVLDEKFQS